MVVLFAAAVVSTVAALYLVGAVLLLYYGGEGSGSNATRSLWNLDLFYIVSSVTLGIISMGSLFKIADLARGGGVGVAESLGGRRIEPATEDFAERRLLNVVEEMAIASGVSVPEVFVLDTESGINAFAAGFNVDDAAIGVTRGCLEQLSRDELQGVIAHEFSHILNGDMRLNLRLMGIVHGILVLSLIGYWILRLGGGDLGGRRGKGSPVLLVGLAVWVIGGIGLFFGKLIKSAVSRQREYLADASAVQFTRNPGGVAGALKRIGSAAHGSSLHSLHAEEVSHMLFGSGSGPSWTAFLATHPPLVDRIRRIEPTFDGAFEVEPLPVQSEPARPEVQAQSGLERLEGLILPAAVAPAAIVASVAHPTPAHIAYASAFLRTLPPDLSDMARDEEGARAVVLALLLDPREGIRARQLGRLPVGGTLRRSVGRAWVGVSGLPLEGRLPLLDLALPALRQQSQESYQELIATVRQLILADDEVSLFEYCLDRSLRRHLAVTFDEGHGATG
jgi:Zn-dependent protease with chaperone function